ncbi:MAG: serpin family protein [Oscillospiraceae bacterium]|nr:serpin family protein [Oscillospiraceae bacterium]
MNKQLKKIISCLLACAFLISLFGCSDYKRSVKKSYEAKLSPRKITPFSCTFTAGINKYGFDVLSDLYSGDNIAVSPASLQLALLMTAMGASGTTKDEMIDALRMTGLSDEELKSSAGQLMWRINGNGMEAANSLWLQDGYGFSEDYLDICSEDFMADLFTVDYKNDTAGAVKDINNWAKAKTHGKIKEVLNDELSGMTRLVLVNALYFLGEWAMPFEANATHDDVFHGESGTQVVPFMHANMDIRYYEGETFQLIILPFRGDDKKSGPFAMSFILPNEDSSPEEVAKELSGTGFESAVAKAVNSNVRVSLPKFEFEYGISMVETMQHLGMGEAFTNSAQFGNMLENDRDDLYVEDIVHKTYIRVDEEGAEAAAVTAVIMNAKSAIKPERETILFNADRPFLFAIYDTTDGTVLFTGVTANLE